jgi:hypothetical protein
MSTRKMRSHASKQIRRGARSWFWTVELQADVPSMTDWPTCQLNQESLGITDRLTNRSWSFFGAKPSRVVVS